MSHYASTGSTAVVGILFMAAMVSGCSEQSSPESHIQTAAQQVAPVSATKPDSGSKASARTGNVPAPQEVKITRWGPQATNVGQAFNVQSNGDSAIWFEATGLNGTTASYELRFGDKKLEGFAIAQNQGGSAQIPLDLIKRPGTYPLSLIDKRNGKQYEFGQFQVAQKK